MIERTEFAANEESKIAFNSPLPASMLNIDAKSRSNLFPWRGQFSPQLVEALLRKYAAPESVVLDPFMGSGTVLVESARLALPVYGCEVNPAAYLLSRVYELCNATEHERREILENAEATLARIRPTAFGVPLSRSRVIAAADRPNCSNETPDPRVRILLDTLTVLVDKDSGQDEAYTSKWAIIRKIVTALPFTTSKVCALFGDARRLKLPDNSINFVLSSPPYINVFNYHHNFRSGVESLGWKPLVVARSEIGANRKFRQNRFLIVIQYCIDMALALSELHRVCHNDACVLLILGKESKVHKTAFYNGQILERIAIEIVGFRLQLKQERVFLNRFGRSIYEDILHLSPQLSCPPSEDALIEHARHLGKEFLLEAAERTSSDQKHYLDEAVHRANRVEPSPILEPDAAVGAPL